MRIRQSGYTLMEVLMTVTILAVLSSVSLPQFIKTRERGYWRGAQDVLLTIYAGEQAYFVANRNATGQNIYRTGLTKTSGAAEWARIYMDNPTMPAIPVTYFVTKGGSGSDTTFQAYAQRQGGSKCLRINQNRQLCSGSSGGCGVGPTKAPCTKWWSQP